jgi:threonine dehydratase
MPQALPTFEDVLAAAARLEGVALKTPVLRSRTLDDRLQAQVFVKCENFQRMGAFKFRGGFNALAKLSDSERRAGVVAYSSGNHAQAVALSAKILQIPATIFMPHDAAPAKLAATQGYGAKVIAYDRYKEDANLLATELSLSKGLTFIPPFDHPDVLSGQGTAALELFNEVGALDALFVCLGGGGLLSGSALAAQALSPGCQIVGVEPAAGNDVQQSLRKGERVKIATPVTIALVHDIHTVTDEQLVQTMRFYAERMKMIVEPTGCLSLAAAFQASASIKGQKVGLIISGGNIDMARFSQLMSAYPSGD